MAASSLQDVQVENFPPPLAWRQQAAEFIKKSASLLWQDPGAMIREYLHGRGINNRSIQGARLGLNTGGDTRPGSHLLKGKCDMTEINDMVQHFSFLMNEHYAAYRHCGTETTGAYRGSYQGTTEPMAGPD